MKPILRDFPYNLETMRLAMRGPLLGDGARVRAAIPRRLGFTHEGTLRCEDRHHLSGELRDTMIFARVHPE